MEAACMPVLLPARRTLTFQQQKPVQKPAVVDALKEHILYSTYRYHYLLLDQFIQLFDLRHTSSSWLQREKIKPLVRGGFLYEQCLSRKSRVGSLPSVYSLATIGRNHMEALGHT